MIEAERTPGDANGPARDESPDPGAGAGDGGETPHGTTRPSGNGRAAGSSIYADEEGLEDALRTSTLPALSTTYVRDRYLPYTRFCENQARKWRIGYYLVRIPVIILATIIPALVAANLGTIGRVTATVLGVVIASLAGIEHFLGVGARWRYYRPAVELLKSEGWLYLTHSGSYAKSDPQAAGAAFAQQVEQMIRADVTSYTPLIAADQQTGTRGGGAGGSTTQAPSGATAEGPNRVSDQ